MKDKDIIKHALKFEPLLGFDFVQWIVWHESSDEFLMHFEDDGYIAHRAWSDQPGTSLDMGSSSRAKAISRECTRGKPALLFEKPSMYHVIDLDSVMTIISHQSSYNHS